MNETIIYRYLSGEASDDEIIQLKKWLEEDPEHHARFFDLKAIWNTRGMSLHNHEEIIEDSLTRLNTRIDRLPDVKRQAPRRNWIKSGSAAAAVLLCIVLSYFYIQDHRANPQDQEDLLSFTNLEEHQSVKPVRLADGTIVWLRANAHLTAPSVFNGKKRLVNLEGEAFFEVKEDTEHPFIVQTRHYEIQVLGTSFNVNSQEGYKTSETTLLSGSVQIQTKDGEKLAILRPGQQAIYSEKKQTVNIREVDANTLTSWRFGLISLSDATIDEIIQCLESTYHTKIQMDISSLKDRSFNFSFKQSKGVETALEQLSYITGISAETEFLQ